MKLDCWEDMLRQLEPDYDNAKYMLEKGPRVVAKLRKFNNKWRVRIETEMSHPWDDENIDGRCDWTAEQLANWKLVTRVSYQEWIFFNQRQAEKFITLYNLKWAQ